MKYWLLIFSILISISSKAQSLEHKLLPLPKLQRVMFSTIIHTDFFKEQEVYDQKISVNYTTSLGNIGNLATFVNMHFSYPRYCQELGMEESMWFKVYLNNTYDLDSLEILLIRGCKEKADTIYQQLSTILQSVHNIRAPLNQRIFIIRVKTEVIFWHTY